MSKPVYVAIDASTLNRVIMQKTVTCSLSHLAALEKMAGTDQISLLIPEVVRLEVTKFVAGMERELSKAVEKLRGKLGDAVKGVWNEISDIETTLDEWLTQWHKERFDECKQGAIAVQSFLKKCGRIDLTPEIVCSAKRRLIADRLPPIADEKDRNKRRDQDALIIESLIAAMKRERGHTSDTPKVVFCSENHADFAIESDGKFALHPTITSPIDVGDDCLPGGVYYPNLNEVVEALKTGDLGPKLTDEQIERIMEERERQIEEATRRLAELNREVFRVQHLLELACRARRPDEFFYPRAALEGKIKAMTPEQRDQYELELRSILGE